MRIIDAIFQQAICEPQKPAMAIADRIVTYDMVARGVLSIESRARLAGIRAGDVVIVGLASPIRDMIASLAMLRLGAISASWYEPESAAAKHLNPDWILVDDLEDVTDSKRAHAVGEDWFTGYRGAIETAPQAYAFQEDEVCRLIFSSGTTGVAKPLAFTPAILRDRVYTCIALNAECHADRTMLAPQLASQMGWVGALANLTTGGMAMFALTAETTMQMIDVYGATNLVATAAQIREILNARERGNFTMHSLRAMQVGAGHIAPTLMRRLESEFCNRILCRYGSTETGIAAFAPGKFLTGTDSAVGVVAPWAVVEALDERGNPLPIGSEGELRLRTDSLAQPFVRGRNFLAPDPQAWFYPGDIGRVDERGLLYITGRSNSIINIGGAKVTPEIVERLLLAQPGIKDAGVAGLIGPSGFDELWAVVSGGEAMQIEAAMEAVNREYSATPLSRIIAGQIPRNAAGKIMREDLRRFCMAQIPRA